MNSFKNTEYRAFPCGFLNRARKSVFFPGGLSGPLAVWTGIVDAKASKVKRLRTESDEATINLAVFCLACYQFRQCASGSESVMESGDSIVGFNGAGVGSGEVPH